MKDADRYDDDDAANAASPVLTTAAADARWRDMRKWEERGGNGVRLRRETECWSWIGALTAEWRWRVSVLGRVNE